MISKKDLLTYLKNAKVAEEKSVQIYTKHISSAIFWTNIKKEDQEEIRAILKRLSDESVGHYQVMEDLINKIEKSGKDAF